MHQHHHNIRRRASLLGIIASSLLIGIPAIANEPPYHRSTLPTTPSPLPGAVPITPPLPSQQQPPSAMVVTINGIVNVTLVNQTAASINYQVIGDTNERPLPGKSNFTLRNLKTPVTITFRRQDGGLLKVTPQTTAEPGMLSVTYTETTNLGTDRSTMRIQRNGSVFLN
ncbi:MAG: hypothetical protein JO235_05205 [Chroococcidiopsidaceae cyanobacterium CP_BM_RX_35]|nr:hypothetical protein [Chroococcidiopsidaceae cyanobacterium CP_BM_RX_35]